MSKLATIAGGSQKDKGKFQDALVIQKFFLQ